MKWYRTNKYKENSSIDNDDIFIPYSFTERGLVTTIQEIKKELDTRGNINSKNSGSNKEIRKLCAKLKISKEEAIKIIKEEKDK